MEGLLITLAIFLSFSANLVSAQCDGDNEISARTHSGWVCGTIRSAANDAKYASFRGIPYAEPPIGKNRFTKLRPKVPWDGYYDAKIEGPVCPQYDDLYGHLVYPNRIMSEECIHVNVHVPLRTHNCDSALKRYTTTRLPILVYIHGGAFRVGSGDADLNGPEFISERIIMITFNYRLNVFGFLSLNSTEIPGNNALRDVLTLLQWVQTNAVAFGGNPDNVTLMGQSSGAVMAHLMSFSESAKGLFKRIIMNSGTAYPSFYTSSPKYAKYIANLFLTTLGINSTDSTDIHQQLIELSLAEIMKANQIVQLNAGLVTFVPVVESPFPYITRMLEDDPIALIKSGRGKEFPVLTGFNSVECETLRNKLIAIDIMKRIKDDPTLILSPELAVDLPSNVSLYLAEQVMERYFNGNPTLDKYIECCTDAFLKYPAINLARLRAASNGAPVYMYYFKYEGDFSAVKEGLDLEYTGAAHIDELPYIFRANNILGNKTDTAQSCDDYNMQNLMTSIVVNFAQCGNPSCREGKSTWSPVQDKHLQYHVIEDSTEHKDVDLTSEQSDMIEFFDTIEEQLKNAVLTGQ